MRVTGGQARGIPLASGGANSQLRPATDRMREAVFSSLGSCVDDARVLDLFAGTGAYGLEALSRGAETALFVEKDRRAVALLKRNLEAVEKSVGRRNLGRVRASDVFGLQLDTEDGSGYDLIFLDPPYAMLPQRLTELLSLAHRHLAHHDAARIVFEMPGETEFEDSRFEILRRLGKGRHQPTVAILARV